MDSPSDGLDKFLPKSIAAKRRRKKALSATDLVSTSDDGAPQSSNGTPGSDANSLHSSLKSSNTDGAVSELLSEPTQQLTSHPIAYSPDRRSTAISAHSSRVGHSTTSSLLAQPEPPVTDGNDSARASTLPRESSNSLESAAPLERSRTSFGPPELRSKRSSSSNRLRDAFKLKKISGDEKSPATDRKPGAVPVQSSEAAPKPSAGRSRRLSRGQKLEPLQAPPRTPPQDAPPPVIVNTPPTPTDPHQDLATSEIPRRPADAVVPGNMSTQRRRAGSNAGPSKLSTSAVPPLTPTPENVPASPNNAAATFFSSMFSAVQNTANQLSTTIPALAQGPSRNKEPSQGRDGADRAQDTVEVESVASQQASSTEPKEPAVKTLGTGDLSLSHLGIVDTPSAAPSPVAARFADTEPRARSESAPAEAHAVDTEHPDEVHDSRPRSAYEPAGGDRTPPAGSVYEGKTGIHRSGSIRSAIGHRRKRGSSVATYGTTATSTIGAAVAAANSSLINPTAGGPKLTGFAVANKKRNRDFHALFKSVPDDDYLIEDYSCALQREILAHGRLYISEGHLCFSSNILGWVTTLVMSFDEIVAVEKRSTALVFKNGLEISTLHAKHIFASFASRDTTYDLIIKIWKLGHPHLQSSLNGVRLEEPGGDRTEKVEDAESVSAVGTHSVSGSDDEGDDGEDIYDEDEDEGGVEAAAPPPDGPVSDVADKNGSRKVSGGMAPPEKAEDGVPTGGADFPGPATHAPTDCGDVAAHFEKVLGDDVIPAPLGKVYNMLFGPASAAWMGRWLTTDQKCTDFQMEDKRGLTDEIRTRNLTYIKPLSGSIGPKQTKCIVTEQLDQFDLEKSVHILVTTQNPDVPSGNIFVVKTRYCLTWAEKNGTRVQISNLIEWSGKSWIKGPIERGANDGQAQYCKDLFATLRAAVSSRARSGSALNGAAVRGKKRSRKSKSALASTPASDAESVVNVSAKQSWGLFEPVRPILSPVVDTIRSILTGNVVYGLLVGLLVASWFGFGTRQGAPLYTHDPAYANAPQRLAAYEEMWRREESDLWRWIEERAGLERLGTDPPLRKRSVDPRTVEERLREERMDERELREAIRVTEEHLEVLKAVVDKKGAEG
ncbi:hypothetical protein N657DRAFT_591897 [Parathielavia appendiculata]|uniref:VASt domain-containing protein n=1 Tax=Parathielavia appendiculata TaxID=2587402 RepID=A0AAN6Z6G8_9PEZI|nr:hypothetical protein N657DRAFT_591897 [Parathielavia appendiculata]